MEQTPPLTLDEVQRLQAQQMLESYNVAANAARRACGMETLAGDAHADEINKAIGYVPLDTSAAAAPEAATPNRQIVPADEMARRAYARTVSTSDWLNPFQQNAEWDRMGLAGR